MIFSKSLLEDNDIGKRIIENSIEKSKSLLNEIFDLDCVNASSNIKELHQGENMNIFKVVFMFGDREINVTLEYEGCGEDLVKEVLIIRESSEESIVLDVPGRDYKSACDAVMNYLEEKYQLDFTPLDPDEEDSNIASIRDDAEDMIYKVCFTHDDHEAIFTAALVYKEDIKQILKINQDKKHCIYFE